MGRLPFLAKDTLEGPTTLALNRILCMATSILSQSVSLCSHAGHVAAQGAHCVPLSLNFLQVASGPPLCSLLCGKVAQGPPTELSLPPRAILELQLLDWEDSKDHQLLSDQTRKLKYKQARSQSGWNQGLSTETITCRLSLSPSVPCWLLMQQ